MVTRALFGRGAVYCCIPHRSDDGQSPVDDQARQGRVLAAELQISVPPELVFADRRRAVWQPEGERAGWAGLLTAIRAGRVETVLVFRPSTLIRHRPADAVELLVLADEHLVALHGFGDDLDLEDPGVRKTALAQARQLSSTSAALSDAVRAAHRQAAESGLPHGGGRRAYGYEPGMRALIPDEVRVVQEIFTRYLAGESLRSVAWDLNARGVPTSAGNAWTTTGVDRVLSAPRYAGLRVFRGSVDRGDGGLRPGMWEPCISLEDWQRAQQERASRAAANADGRPRAHYLLTGLVVCGRCHAHMVGSIVGDYRMYACASQNPALPKTCTLRIAAASLERFVGDAAVQVLRDLRDLSDLRDLDGVVTGPKAARGWRRLPEERRAAVLRTLFSTIVIGPKTTARGVFDTSRIELVRATVFVP